MLAVAVDWKRKRENLQGQRASPSAEYEKRPNEVLLALKVKVSDDQIAECTEHIVQEKLASLPSH